MIAFVLYAWSVDLPKKNLVNSPVRVYEHTENGIQVSSCTRGKESGTTSGTYRSTKYVTPSTSRYYSSRQKNASSTGYAGGGSIQPVVIWDTEANDDGTVTVTGWHGNASILNIPETIDGKTVTKIGDRAFRNNQIIRHVIIPKTVANIGTWAFSDCGSLRSVQILGTIEESDWSFSGCSELDDIVFGSEVKKIPGRLFQDCTGLTHVEIPGGITEIGNFAFSGCTNLANVTFNKGLKKVGFDAFLGCVALKNIVLPEGLNSLDASFKDCISIESVYIPATIEESDWAFSGCQKLSNVTFGSGIEKVPGRLFQDCTGLTHIEIPGTVTEIGNWAFSGCDALKSISFGKYMSSIAFCSFSKCTNLTDVYYGGTQPQWAEIKIDSNNDPLIGATIHYNADIPNTPDTKPEPTPTPGPTDKPTPTPPVTPTPSPTSTPKFTDVKSGAYYYDAVIWAVKKGVTSGTGNNKFSPNASCTRGQIVTFLWRAAGSPDPVSSANPFSDVKPSDYFYKAVLWAVENNITSGIGGGRFGPGGACTRGQAVTFLWRAEKSPNASAGSLFSDVKSGSYYEKAVDWAVSKNVTSGTGNGKFSPDASCTRGQIVTFLYRANG